MKSFKLNVKSWHGWLYNFGRDWDRLRPGESVDLCSYIRGVFFHSLLVLFLGGALSLMVFGSIAAFANVFSWLFLGYILEPAAVVVVGIYASIGALAAFLHYKQKRDEANYDKPKPPPGFVKLAYSKFKEKTCAMIEFE
jgi:hypothetical protein